MRCIDVLVVIPIDIGFQILFPKQQFEVESRLGGKRMKGEEV